MGCTAKNNLFCFLGMPMGCVVAKRSFVDVLLHKRPMLPHLLHVFPNPPPHTSLFVSRSPHVPQQIGMDHSKHGGQTYPEMVKGAASA